MPNLDELQRSIEHLEGQVATLHRLCAELFGKNADLKREIDHLADQFQRS